MNRRFQFPEMAFVRQPLYHSSIKDAPGTIRAAFEPLSHLRPAGAGETVAIAVGSRNIDNLDGVVLKTICFLREKGFKPFIVPAMGSHGGATPDGQRSILERYGISEAAMNAPVNADMAVECIGVLPSGLPIFAASSALSADHIVLINRVKRHTKFRADIESGICKMMTIGLGKQKGASEFHRFAVAHTFSIIEEAARFLLGRLHILFSIAMVEDGFGKLAHIEILMPENIISREKELLKDAARMAPRIPFDNLDILIVDQIGKDISGIGMDANVTGRHRDIVGNLYDWPHAKRIFVRDLSLASEGNANGIGLADVTTTRLVAQIDMHKTFLNAITAISPEKAAIPIHFDTDLECLEACMKTTGVADVEALRVARIKNTAQLEQIQVSRSCEGEFGLIPGLKQLTSWAPIEFDPSDNMTEFNVHE
ncbi:MAG: DUF362 domain-containing protein [Desulfobacterales bacterium]|jgi:hypothetical protein|nr:DUF362 domain-containing protein [Desulfobacterales bacterium]